MNLRRLAICVALLGATTVTVELYFGAKLEELAAEGAAIPPFGIGDDPTVRALVEERLVGLEVGEPRVVIGCFHADYGWCNRAGTAPDGDRTLHINGLGARGSRDVRSATPDPGVTRVLCFGDSFTYGTEVADGEDWPSILEERGDDLEVLNFGVGGWGTDQALLCFRDLGPKLSPDVVVVGLFLGNIARHVNRYRPLLYPNDQNPVVKPRFRLVEDQLRPVPVPYSSRRELYTAFLENRVVDELSDHEYWSGDDPLLGFSNLSRFVATRNASERRDTATLWKRPDLEPFRVTAALLQAFHDEALAAGAQRFAVVLFSRKEDLWVYRTVGWEKYVYWSGLREELERREIAYIDAYAALRAASLEGPVYLEQHLSPAGNRAVAEVVDAWLRDSLVQPAAAGR